jgi:hypothetical protein
LRLCDPVLPTFAALYHVRLRAGRTLSIAKRATPTVLMAPLYRNKVGPSLIQTQ